MPISTGRPCGVQLADLLDHRRPLVVGRAEDAVGQPLADRRPVGGNRQHVAAVDSPQLAGRAHRRAGHAGQLLVAQEEVLHRDPRRLAGGHGHLDALLGLDGLMDAVAPFAAFGQPAGELVDDHDLAVADHVLPVEMILAVDQDRPLDVLVDVDHADGVHRLAAWPAGGPSAGPRASVRPSFSRGRTRSPRPRRTPR